MEIRERHTPSRANRADSGVLPGSMNDEDGPTSGVYVTRTSARPARQSATLKSDLENDIEALDGGYGSKETLSKEEMLQQEAWNFPVRPIFPSDDDSDDEDEDMAVMTTCCCCFSTKNGSIGVGIISLVVAFCASVSFCFALINVEDLKVVLKAAQTQSEIIKTSLNTSADAFGLLEKIVGFNNFVDYLQTILIVFLVFYAIYTFACLFLTYGACTNIRSLLLPWLVLEFGPFGLQLAGIIIMFVYGKDDPILAEGGTYIIAGLLQIVAFVIHVYWWMCPLAHYQTLKEETEVEPLTRHDHLAYPGRMNKF